MGLAGNLHLLCGDCERVAFENRMLDIDIHIEEIAAGGKTRGGWTSTSCYRVRDRDRLLIECGILRIAYNIPPVFGLD